MSLTLMIRKWLHSQGACESLFLFAIELLDVLKQTLSKEVCRHRARSGRRCDLYWSSVRRAMIRKKMQIILGDFPLHQTKKCFSNPNRRPQLRSRVLGNILSVAGLTGARLSRNTHASNLYEIRSVKSWAVSRNNCVKVIVKLPSVCNLAVGYHRRTYWWAKWYAWLS